MNIFYLSDDPIQCAEWMVDRHVVKMILETAQLLSTAHRVLDGEQYVDKQSGRSIKRWALNDNREQTLYKATHVNHPSAVWVREAVENYNWLFDHFIALNNEYTYRFEKIHLSKQLGVILSSPPLNLKDWDMTPMCSAMDTKYLVSKNPIDNYRNYYKMGKTHLHKWTKRSKPEWI